MAQMKNRQLKEFYDRVYAKGEKTHYSKLLFQKGKLSSDKLAVLREVSWRGKRVLDVGCGIGEVCYHIVDAGAKEVVGIDYSPKAIEVANATFRHANLSYRCMDVRDIKGKFDVIISMGTLEHIDDPLGLLKRLKTMLRPSGSIIITCPNWSNPRGYILLTLKYLFAAPITLADIHYFTPLEFEKWGSELDMRMRWKTVDHDWAHGQRLIADFERRLPNVLRDAKLPMNEKRIREFIAWVRDHIPVLERDTKFSGAIGLYHFR